MGIKAWGCGRSSVIRCGACGGGSGVLDADRALMCRTFCNLTFFLTNIHVWILQEQNPFSILGRRHNHRHRDNISRRRGARHAIIWHVDVALMWRRGPRAQLSSLCTSPLLPTPSSLCPSKRHLRPLPRRCPFAAARAPRHDAPVGRGPPGHAPAAQPPRATLPQATRATKVTFFCQINLAILVSSLVR